MIDADFDYNGFTILYYIVISNAFNSIIRPTVKYYDLK